MSRDRIRRRVPFVAGVVAAHAAWLVGVAAAFVAVRTADHEAIVDAAIGDAPAPDFYQVITWAFFNAHAVPVRVSPLTEGDPPAPFTVTLLGGDGFAPALSAVPVAALVLAGAAVAYYGDSPGPVEGLVAGLTVVPGYLALAVATALIGWTAWGFGSTGNAGPAPATALLQAGLLYPALFAGGGGLLAGVVATVASENSDVARATSDE